MEKKIVVLVSTVLLMVLSSLLMIGCGQNNDRSPQASATNSEQSHKTIPSLLFFQTISQGSYKDGILSLEEDYPQVMDYSDGNLTMNGYITAQGFVNLWNLDSASFSANPPRAVLNILGKEGSIVVLELSSPRLNNQMVDLNAKVISGNMPSQFGEATFYVNAIPRIVNSLSATPPSNSFPAAVNHQITDSVTQANFKVLGDAPAVAMGNLYQATAQALSNIAHNATNAQQQSNMTSQAATTMGVSTLYSIDTIANSSPK